MFKVIKKEISKNIDENLVKTFEEEKIKSNIENEISDVYRHFNYEKIIPSFCTIYISLF